MLSGSLGGSNKSLHTLTCTILVADENRKFEATGVPGQHEIVVWHEGGASLPEMDLGDVLTDDVSS